MIKFLFKLFPSLIIFSFIPFNLGVNSSGIAWFILFVVTVLFILEYRFINKFWLKFWAPWLIYIFLSFLFNINQYSFHFTLQISVPILIFLFSVSIKKYSLNIVLMDMINISFLVLFYIIFLRFSTSIIGGSVLIFSSIISIVCIYLYYETFKFKYILFSFCFFFPTIIFSTRTSALIVLISIIFILLSKHKSRRFLILLSSISLLFIFFNIPLIKNKMLFDPSLGYSFNFFDTNVRTSGRIVLWEYLIDNVSSFNNYLFGNGSRSSYFLLKNEFITIHEPHNDYIRLFYDFGIIGLLIYCISIIRIWFYINIFTDSINLRILGKSLILSYCILMLTDNAIIYVLTCSGLIFLILGQILAKPSFNHF